MSELHTDLLGEMPLTAAGVEVSGLFFTNQPGGVVEISPNLSTWGSTVTVAGGTFTLTQVDASTWQVTGTPTTVGSFMFYIRVFYDEVTTAGRGIALGVYSGSGSGYGRLYAQNINVTQIVEDRLGGTYLSVTAAAGTISVDGVSVTTSRRLISRTDGSGTWMWAAAVEGSASSSALIAQGTWAVDSASRVFATFQISNRTSPITLRNADGSIYATFAGSSYDLGILLVCVDKNGFFQWHRFISTGASNPTCNGVFLGGPGESVGWIQGGASAGNTGFTISVPADGFSLTSTNQFALRFAAVSGVFTAGAKSAPVTSSTQAIYPGSVDGSGFFFFTYFSSVTATFGGVSQPANEVALLRVSPTNGSAQRMKLANNYGLINFYNTSVVGSEVYVAGTIRSATAGILNTSPATNLARVGVQEDLLLVRVAQASFPTGNVAAYWRTTDSSGVSSYGSTRVRDLNCGIDGVLTAAVQLVGASGSTVTWGSSSATLGPFTYNQGAIFRFDTTTQVPLGISLINNGDAVVEYAGVGVYGGGYALFRPAATTVNKTFTLNPGAVDVIVPANTGTRSLVATFDRDGLWGVIDAPTGTPSDGNNPPDPPFALSPTPWPASATESGLLSVIVGAFDPEETGANLFLQIRNPQTGAFVTTPVVDGVRQRVRIPGKGYVTIIQATDDEVIPPAYGTADLLFEPDEDWYGTVSFDLRWHLASFDRYSAVARFTTVYANDPEPVSQINGSMPDCLEDATATGVFTAIDPDATGTYTWQLSPQFNAPEGWDPETDPDFHSTTGSTVRVKDDEGTEVGTATILSQNNANRTANVRFTPDAHWHGSVSFDLRVDNGSGGWSEWVTLYLTVEAVADAPTAIAPTTLANISEDGVLVQTFNWSDPDTALALGPGSYAIQLALDIPSFTWVDMTEEETFDLGDVVLRLLEVDEAAQTATLRIEPKANWYGPYSFRMRVVDSSDSPDLFGPAAVVSGEVVSVPDAPSRITPRTMPKTRPGKTVSQAFTTVDPDPENTTWTFEYSLSRTSGWTTSDITVPGRGVLSIINGSSADKTCTVSFAADAAGYGRCQFYIRVTDSSGLVSEPELVTGYVVGAGTQILLQYLDRSAPGAAVPTPICPLTTLSELSITTALNGPGSASLSVSASEIASRAEQTGLSVTDLLAPGAVEVVVNIGIAPLFVGPISSWDYDAAGGDGIVRIYASGLLSYFEGRTINAADPTDETDYVNDDQSEIVWDLISDTQSATGGHLALTDGTVPTGTNTTITFPNTHTIAECLSELQREPGAAEVWIDADRTVRSASARGTDRRGSIRLTESLGTRVSRFARSDDVVTSAIVVGADSGSGVYWGSYTDATAAAKFGRLTRVVEAPHLLSNASCEALAEEIVKRHKDVTEAIGLEIVLDPYRGFAITDIAAGDVITIDVRDPVLGRVLRDVRVINMTLDMISESSDSFTISLDTEPAVYIDGVLQGSRSRHVAELYETAYEALYRGR